MPDQNQAPAFDPNAPYQPAPTTAPDPSAAPAFDPNAPYQAASVPMTAPGTGRLNDIAQRGADALTSEVGNVVGGVVQPVKTAAQAVATPPQDPREHAIFSKYGPDALIAYRAARGVTDAAENWFKAKKENAQQTAADMANAVQEFHQGNYRNGLADTASVAAGAMGLSGTQPAVDAGRARDIAQGSKPGGDIVTPVVKDLVDLGAAAAAEKTSNVEAGDVVDAASHVYQNGKIVAKAAKELPGKAVATAGELKPEWLTKREPTPEPQHGTPVKVESPLDSATVGKQLGGKDLSQEALDTLQKHVGDKVPVGSTAKNRLTAAVEPVVNAINDTASKMNKVVQKASDFTTSVMQDSVFGEGSLTKEIDNLKENIPASEKAKLSADADAVVQDADKALNTTNPVEILEYRRQLGRKIDWDSIEKNPSTPGEVQNAARAKVYQQLTGKIHEEIPETVALDKILQPNLELRSHLVRKVGERLVDDPIAATTEAESELKKGKATVENAVHNEAVAKNWQRVKTGLIALGVGGGIIHEIEKFLP